MTSYNVVYLEDMTSYTVVAVEQFNVWGITRKAKADRPRDGEGNRRAK